MNSFLAFIGSLTPLFLCINTQFLIDYSDEKGLIEAEKRRFKQGHEGFASLGRALGRLGDGLLEKL